MNYTIKLITAECMTLYCNFKTQNMIHLEMNLTDSTKHNVYKQN